MAKNATQTISKSEAVRQAIAAGKTMPNEGIAYIKETFGIKLSSNHFSNIKSSATGKKKKRGRPKGSKSSPKPEPVAVAMPGATAAPRSKGIDIEAVQQVKDLVGKLGADTAKRLVDTLAGA